MLLTSAAVIPPLVVFVLFHRWIFARSESNPVAAWFVKR
jgi:hypothetical protein